METGNKHVFFGFTIHQQFICFVETPEQHAKSGKVTYFSNYAISIVSRRKLNLQII